MWLLSLGTALAKMCQCCLLAVAKKNGHYVSFPSLFKYTEIKLLYPSQIHIPQGAEFRKLLYFSYILFINIWTKCSPTNRIIDFLLYFLYRPPTASQNILPFLPLLTFLSSDRGQSIEQSSCSVFSYMMGPGGYSLFRIIILLLCLLLLCFF